MSDGHNQKLFLNQQDIESYICSICLDVFNNATSISCDADHLFCEYCLLKYYGRNTRGKSCPQCQQKGLKKSGIQKRSFTNRIIGAFQIRCSNQLKEEEEKVQIGECKWNGCLSELNVHLSNYCILTLVKCLWCNKEKKRFQIEDHNDICPLKPIPCHLNCGEDIPRQDIVSHIDNDCINKEVPCFHCDQMFKRNESDKHNDECPEAPIACSFAIYGCNVYIKRRLLDKHIKKEKTKHLQLKVASLEKKLEDTINTVQELNKAKDEYIKAAKDTEHEFKQEISNLRFELRFRSFNDINKATKKLNFSSLDKQILMILNPNQLRICDIKSKLSFKSTVPNFWPHNCHCIAKNVSFVSALNMGFSHNELNFNGNDLLIGINSNAISVVNIKSRTKRTFHCSITSRAHSVIYSKQYGVVIAGGRQISDKNIQCKKVITYKFSNSSLVRSVSSNNLNDAVSSSSIILNDNNYDEKLLICGGWWNKRNLHTARLYDFKSSKVTQLKHMKSHHQTAGICQWKERQNKIIVGGGFSQSKIVEEYDTTKNIWTFLPSLNNVHSNYPLLLPSNNVLFCIGGAGKDLGTIEMYDPRDFQNKWVVVDTVHKYFNIPENTIFAGGYNHCLAI